MSTYYGCPGCQASGGGTHICGLGLTAGGNVYSNVTWTTNATGGAYVTCGVCRNLMTQCACWGKYTWQPYPSNPFTPNTLPSNPITPTTGIKCIYCGAYGCSGMCQFYGGLGTGTLTSPSWNIINNVIEWLNDIKLFDIQTEDLIKGHDSLLTILTRTPEKGFLGTLEYIKLPSLFQNYFLKVGKDESAMDIWYMISPLVFRLLSQDKDKKENSHMVVVLGVKNLELEETKEEIIVHLKKVRLLEIKDNLAFIQLAERDKAYRKHISK